MKCMHITSSSSTITTVLTSAGNCINCRFDRTVCPSSNAAGSETTTFVPLDIMDEYECITANLFTGIKMI
jgi:hypothetical protein